MITVIINGRNMMQIIKASANLIPLNALIMLLPVFGLIALLIQPKQEKLSVNALPLTITMQPFGN